MELDVPLKVLFRRYAADLLRLTHDDEASVLFADAVELQAVNRRVDCLIKLRRKGQVYYRHFEFQSEADSSMAERGGKSLDVIAQAAATIERALPGERNPEARSILLYPAGALYNVDVLTRLFGREKMIQSSVWQAAWSEGKAEGIVEGRAEGVLAEQKELCLELIKVHHPTLWAKAKDAVDGCSDRTILRKWILNTGQLDDPAFARLLGIG